MKYIELFEEFKLHHIPEISLGENKELHSFCANTDCHDCHIRRKCSSIDDKNSSVAYDDYKHLVEKYPELFI